MDAQLTLTLWYSNDELHLAWPAQEDVYGYAYVIRDSSDTVVFSGQVLAADYQNFVTVPSDSLSPIVGETYTATAWIIGPPSETQNVVIVNLVEPVVTANTSIDSVTLTWDAQDSASGYDVEVLQGKNVVINRPNIPDTTITFTPADGLQENVSYTARVRAAAGHSYSVWSSPTTVLLFSPASILHALLNALLGNKPAENQVVLNDVTLAAGAGSPDLILQLIQQTLKVDELLITVDADPVLNEDQTLLTIDGTATVLNADDTPIHFAFTVGDDMLLQLVMNANLLDSWAFTDSFPNKNLGIMDLWETSARQFWLSSYAHTEDAVFFALTVGLNFLGTLSISADFMPTTTDGAVVQAVLFGGGIDNQGDSLSFQWTGAETVQDLSLKPLEWAEMTFTGGTLRLESTPSQNEENTGNVNDFRIEGTISFIYGDLPFSISLPTNPVSPITAITRPQAASFATLGTVIDDIPGTVLPSYLPVSLSGLGPVNLQDLVITFDPAQAGPTYSVLEVGTDSSWLLSIFSLDNPRIAIDSRIVPSPYGDNFRADQLALKATISMNSVLFDVALLIPPAGDWVLQVVNTQPTLSDIATLMGTTASAIVSTLPAPLQGMGNFVPTKLEIAFNPFTPSFSSLTFRIEQIEPWVIVQDILEVSNWTIDMGYWWNNGDWTLSSLFEGDIVIATLPVHMKMPIPAGQQGWTLSFAQQPITVPGFGDLLRLIGAQDTADLLPQGVQDLGSLTILRLDINLDLNNLSNPVRRLIFQITTPTPWQLLPAESLILETLDMGINVSLDSATNSYVAIGYIRGILNVLGTQVYLQTQRTSASAPWIFLLSTVRIIHVPGLADLAAWMLPASMLAYIPVNFMPFSAGLDINTFNLEFDLTNANLNLISFFIRNSEAWGIIPDYITLDNVFVDSTITNPLAESPGLVARIQGTLILGTLPIVLAAVKATIDADWVFSGTITPGSVIDFVAIFNEYVPSISMPYDYGFPRSVTIVEGSTSIVPATSFFQFALSTVFDWQFNMGFTTLSINALSANLDVEAPNEQGVRPYTFNASGSFTFVGIDTKLTFTTSNGVTDTIILGVMSTSPQAINLPSVSNQLMTNSNTGDETWTTVLPHVPVGFADFGTLTIQVALNLTQNLFLLYGTSERFGSIAYMMQELESGTWGYFVSVKLADNFTFASLLPALSVIDNIMTFQDGSLSFAYSSYDVSSAQALTSVIPAFSSAFSLTNSYKPTPIKPGVNFYAALNFGSSTLSVLFSNVVVMLDGVENTPDLVLYGWIGNETADDATNTSLNALFRATLGDFSVLGLMQFHGVTFQFEMAQNTVISLLGDMIISVSGQSYTFHGDLSVSNLEANFSIIQTQPPAPSQSMINPMSMTGVTLNDLRLIFQYVYATSAVTLEMGGTVYYGSGNSLVTLSGLLALVNNSPALVEMALSVTPQLGIIAFVVQSVITVQYPPSYFDFYFISGSMYYYDSAADVGQKYHKTSLNGTEITHVDGFNIQSTFSMFSRLLSIELHVSNKGFTATGKMLDSFDLGFVEFTDYDFTGSPSLFIKVLTDEQAFGLKIGFIFFQEHFATGEVSIVLEDQQTNVPQLRGRFTYAGSIQMFVGSSITFTYDEENGFQVDDWPFDFLYGLDYAALMDGFEMPGCGELVNLVFDKVVQTDFVVNPVFSVQGSALIITLKGAYTITLLGTDSPFLVVGMPDIPIHINAPSSFTLSALPDMILSSIADSAQDIVDSLLNDPLKLGIFLTTVGVSKVAPDVIADIACYSGEATESVELVEAAEGFQAAAEEAMEAADIAFEAFEAAVEAGEVLAAAEALLDLLAAGTAATAAVAGVLEVAADVGAGLAVAAAVGATLAAAAYVTYKIGQALFGDDDDDNGDPTDPSNHDAPQLEKARISNVTYESGNIIVSWQSARNAEGYRISLNRGSTEISSKTTQANRLTVTFPTDDLTAGTYSVKVSASAGGYKGSTSDASDITMLSTPAPYLAVNGDDIVATWNGIHSASGYFVHWTKDGADLKSERVTSTTSSVAIDGRATYAVQVLADGDLYHIPSQWSQPTSLNITSLNEPTNLHVTYNANTQSIDVSWDSVNNASGYSVQLVKDGTPFGDVVSENNTHHAFFITGLAPAIYKAQVMATSSTVGVLSSDWNISTEQVQILGTPSIGSVTYTNGSVVVTLSSAVNGAAGYIAQFVGENDAPIGETVSNNGLTLTLTDTLVPAGTYQVRVQSTAADVHAVASDWVTSAQTVLTLAVPTLTLAEYQLNNLSLEWSAVVGATGYNIEIRAPDGQVALTGQTRATTGENPQPAATTLTQDITNLAPNITYTVVVQAIDDSGSGAWDTGTTLFVMDTPVITSATYQTDILALAWSPVTNATGYNIEIRTPEGAVALAGQTRAVEGDTPQPAATMLSIDISNLPPNINYTVVVQAIDSSNSTAWSIGIPLFEMATPVFTTVSYQATALTLVWSAVTNATGYNLEIRGADGIALLTGQTRAVEGETPEPAATTFTVDITTLLPDTPYSVVIQATDGIDTTAWSAETPLFVMATPLVTSAIYQSAVLTVDWTVVANATGYNLEIRGADGIAVLSGQTRAVEGENPEPTATTLTLDITTLLPDTPYSVVIQATDGIDTTAWSAETPLFIMAIPVVTSALYQAAVLTVDWAVVTNATGYNLEIRDADGIAVLSGQTRAVEGENPEPAATTITVDIATLLPDTPYTVVIQATDGVDTTAWSVETPLFIMATPVITSAVYQAAVLTIDWAVVTNATGYNLEIRGADGIAVLSRQTRAVEGENPEPAATTLTVDITTLLPDTPYTVVIQATDGIDTTAWSAETPLFIMATPVVTSAVYQAAVLTVDWAVVANATGYNLEIRGADGTPILTGQTRAVEGETPEPAATTLTVDMITLLPDTPYTVVIQATDGIDTTAWSAETPLFIMVTPILQTFSITDNTLSMVWSEVTGATFYTVQVVDSQQQPVLGTPTQVDAPSTNLTLDTTGLPAGNYFGSLQAGDAQNNLTSWSAVESVEIADTPVETPESLAQQLHDEGKTAQQAAPILIGQFPTELADPSAMISLLVAYFPESTKTLTQIAWALAEAGYSNSAAMTALNTAYPNRISDVSAAIKAAYPAPSVMSYVEALQKEGISAQAATPLLREQHTDLTALDMAVLMMMQFESTVPDPTSMAQALLNGFYVASEATEAISETFPLSSIADIAAAINAVYPMNPTALAQYIHAIPRAGQVGATFIKASFPNPYNTDAVGMINLVVANFPESTKTLTQIAWALGEARYSDTDAMAALNTVYPGQLANVSAAIKAAYPAPSVKQTIAELHTQPDVNAIVAATKLQAVYPDLTALQMAVTLRMYFTVYTTTPPEMAQALQMATYSANDATEALYETYPLSSIADIAAAINAAYIVP